MADNTPIEWADATVNAINGCTRVSPGCGGPGEAGGCYAERLTATRLKNVPSREGLATMTAKGPRWTGKIRLHEPALLQPLRWRRPRTIFWNAHGDTFHEAVPDDWLFEMFEVIRRTPHHKHLVLTKRAARMRDFIKALTLLPSNINAFYDLPKTATLYQPLRNLWLGVSVENQATANERIPMLLDIPAQRFLSCEPLLGPIDLASIVDADADECFEADATRGRLNVLTGIYYVECQEPDGSWEDCCGPDVVQRGFDRLPNRAHIHGVIVGGESGPGARPMHPDWARSIRDDCAAAGVDFHFKQWGAHSPLRNDLIPVPAKDIGWMQADGRVEYNVSDDRAYEMAVQKDAADRNLFNMMVRVGKKNAGRTLDGGTHDALPWRQG